MSNIFKVAFSIPAEDIITHGCGTANVSSNFENKNPEH